MARESVQELIVRIKQEGLGNLEFLKKELKQVSSQSKISEGSINKLQKEIKDFGRATKSTTDGLKGQISAFQKLRAQTGFQSQAYNSLSKEIAGLNRQLEKRLGFERDLDRMSGRPSRTAPPPGDRAILNTRLKDEWTTGGTEQFALRQASMQAMLIGRTFESLREDQKEFLKSFTPSLSTGLYDVSRLKGAENTEFRKLIAKSNADFLASSQRGPGGKMLLRGDHSVTTDQIKNQGVLNEIQRAALNITEDLSITSQNYLEVLTKINAETRVQANQLSSADAFSEARGALARSDIRTSTDLKAQQDARIKSFLYQDERAAYDSKATTSKFRKAGIGPAEKIWKEGQFQWVQDIQAMLGMVSEDWQAPGYKAMLREMDQYPKAGKKRDQVRLDRTDTRAYKTTYGQFQLPIKLDAQKPHIDVLKRMSEERQQIADPMGLGADPKYPKTRFGLGEELKNLQKDLPHLKDGTKPWLDLVERIAAKNKEINELIKKGNEAIKARKKEIAQIVNPKVNQKLLPAAGQTSGQYTVKQLQSRIAAEYGPAQFTAEQYGPQLETQDQLIKRLQETIKVRTNSIKTVTEHRNKLEDIRKTLDPTSAKFKSVAKSIKQADTQLAKLNKTSKGFGKKGLLGFGQSILGGAYFGGPFGAVGAGIGQIFGGQSGAATGGLVGAQIGRPVSQFLGGSTTYASGIAKSQIALRKATEVKDEDKNVVPGLSDASFSKAMKTAQFAIEELNIPQEVAIKGMTRLSAAVIGAGGNVANASEAFLSITSAIKGTAGNTEDVKAAITAMVQIFSKGKVSAEELSGQLGERFPAAVTKFADANNLRADELQKSLKDGTVGLDMLSKFVASLGKEFLPVALEISGSAEEAGARMTVMFNTLRKSVGDALKPAGAEFQTISANILKQALPALIKFAEQSGKFLLGFAEVLKSTIRTLKTYGDVLIAVSSGFVIGKVIGGIGILISSKFALLRVIIKLRKELVKLNLTWLKNPAVRIAAILGGVYLGYTKAQRGVKSFIEEVTDGTKSIEQADEKIAELKKGLEAIQEAEDKGISFMDTKALKEINEQLGVTKLNMRGINTLDDVQGREFKFAGLRADELRVFIDMLGEAKKVAGDTAVDIEALWKELTGGKVEFPAWLKDGGKDQGPLAKFRDQLEDTTGMMENLMVGTFKKMEDALTDFVMTGKLKFKDFARSVIADITRIAIRQAIIAPIVGTLFPGADKATKSFKNVVSASAKGNVFAKNKIVPYAKGGIVNSPTLFPFANGVGLMSEIGPEAIMPLKRGKGGRLGVEVAGGGGSTVVNISVDAKGTSVEGQDTQAKMLGKMLSTAVQAEIARQKRPGGILN